MQRKHLVRAGGLLSCALFVAGCTASATQEAATTLPETERVEFIDRVGIQWIDFPNPDQASFNGGTVTVARGTTLQISATECQRPGMTLAGDAASLGKVENRVVYNERNIDNVRDISLYLPPLLPEGEYELTTTCSWNPDLGNDIDLSVNVVVVDKPNLVLSLIHISEPTRPY